MIDDQIDVVTRGLLGLTVACARCHDHKYDAIPTADSYSLYATLASSHSPELLPIIGEPSDTQPYREYEQELSRRQEMRDQMAREQNAVMRSRLKMQVGEYLKEFAKGTPEQDLSSPGSPPRAMAMKEDKQVGEFYISFLQKDSSACEYSQGFAVVLLCFRSICEKPEN